MTTTAFLSVGRTTSPEQEQFVKAVEAWLFANDVRPVALGRNDWSSEQPLKAIKERMETCDGAVVIAFERTHISEGVDRGKPEGENFLENEGLPTVWNQIEAAMAHTLGHPLLVIVEEGLVTEGLLEGKYDWIVQSLPLDPARLETPQSLGILADWKALAVNSRDGRQAKATGTVVDVDTMKVGQILGSLDWRQTKTLIVAVVGALTAIVATAFSLGVKFG